MTTKVNDFVSTHRDLYVVKNVLNTTDGVTLLDAHGLNGDKRIILEARSVPKTRNEVLQSVFLDMLVSIEDLMTFGLTLDEVRNTFGRAMEVTLMHKYEDDNENNNGTLAVERVD